MFHIVNKFLKSSSLPRVSTVLCEAVSSNVLLLHWFLMIQNNELLKRNGFTMSSSNVSTDSCLIHHRSSPTTNVRIQVSKHQKRKKQHDYEVSCEKGKSYLFPLSFASSFFNNSIHRLLLLLRLSEMWNLFPHESNKQKKDIFSNHQPSKNAEKNIQSKNREILFFGEMVSFTRIKRR